MNANLQAPTPEQRFLARLLLDQLDRLPRPEAGPARLHVDSATAIAEFARTAVSSVWPNSGARVPEPEDLPTLEWEDIDVEPGWLPNQAHLASVATLLWDAITPGNWANRTNVLGSWLLLAAHYADLYAAEVDLINQTNRIAFTNPMWCNRCRARSVDRATDTCTTCGWEWHGL